MPSIALTDNGNLFGAMEFTKKALKSNIQPILGSNILVGYGADAKLKNNFFQITCLIINELLNISNINKTSLLIATHDLSIAKKMDKVYNLINGKLIEYKE